MKSIVKKEIFVIAQEFRKFVSKFFVSIQTSYSKQLASLCCSLIQDRYNRIFKDIDTQQDIIDTEVAKWMEDKNKTKKLCGYEWIVEQWKHFVF